MTDLRLVTVLGLALMGVVATTLLIGEERPPPTPVGGGYNTTTDGTRYTVHPSRLVQGCPGLDCIPSIEEPRFDPAADVGWLEPDDLVIGLSVGGEAKAYPFRILSRHEIVNDVIGGEPVAVTYCPLCRSGFVYSRQVGDRTLEFGVSGKLLNANLVMYDRQTETYWSQIQGEAIVGPLVPSDLEIVSSTITEWENWQTTHPDTRVLTRESGGYSPSVYDGTAYAGYDSRPGVGFGVGETDDRLFSKALVYGVTVGNVSKAYPEELVKQEDVVQDTVNGRPLLVIEDQQLETVRIFERTVDGETMEFDLEGGSLVDQDGREWSFDGVERTGNRAITAYPAHGVYWFAWSQFHPETGLYNVTG